MQKKRRLIIILSVFLILSLGCSAFGQVFSSRTSVKSDGTPPSPTLPAPQDTPDGKVKYRKVNSDPPTLPVPPKPIAAPQGSPDEQALYFADQLGTGKDHLGLWMGLYDALAIPLIGQDGIPLGSTGDDPIGPRFWQVWYSSGMDLPGRGITLTDMGTLFAVGLPALGRADTGAMLLSDLSLAAQSDDPRLLLMGQFVRQRILRGSSHVDILDTGVAPDAVTLDIPTMQLISWVIIRSALFQAAAQASVPAGSIALVDYHPRPAAQLGPQANCSDMPGSGSSEAAVANWLINKVGGGFQLPGMEKAFPSLIERAVEKSVADKSEQEIKDITDRTGKMMAYANLMTSAISAIMQYLAMTINPSQSPDSLIRTHHTSDGEEGTITLQLYSAPDKLPNGDELEMCVASFFMNTMGISFTFPPEAPVPGAEIVIDAGEGIPDLVKINQKNHDISGIDGKVIFNVIGNRQKKDIPLNAPAVQKEFSVEVSAQLEEAGLGSMVNLFFGGLTGLSGVPAFLSSLIDALKTFKYPMGEYVFILTDWVPNGYRASGQVGSGTWSGVVCSLEQPFTINALPPDLVMPFKFTPTGPQAGTVSLDVTQDAVHWYGSGTYTVQGIGMENPSIVGQLSESWETSNGAGNVSVDIDIQLSPLDTNECSQP